MRLYASAVTQPMLLVWAEYAQYMHPVDEALLQRLEQAGQPVPATAAFLWDDLAVMVVEGLLNQIKLMKRQCMSTLEQIEHVGKRKAPVFEELMVEPKRARAPLQHPQELAWAPARTVARLPLRPLKLASGASTSRSVHMGSAPMHRKLDENLLHKTMRALLYDPMYRDLQSPIQGKEDKEPRHILTCFTHIKEDGTTALHVMCAPDPSQPFDLKQIAQYVLIFGRLGLENTWQGIAFDFAYRIHWRTLFGFALCRALCTTSTAKPAVVRRLVLVMARPGMYREAVASYNAAFLDQPMVAQYGSHLNIIQVHVPDKMA
ncbi:hypothetical protein C0995_008825 [Termitomyces sp. Mi166|nr:hypothetical protein C0995_008825 [Termitomyces sp. Mi166\